MILGPLGTWARQGPGPEGPGPGPGSGPGPGGGLRGKGVPENEILEQLAELTAPNFYEPVPQVGTVLTNEVRSRDGVEPLRQDTPTEEAFSDDEGEEDQE